MWALQKWNPFTCLQKQKSRDYGQERNIILSELFFEIFNKLTMLYKIIYLKKLLSSPKDMYINLRERERERERNIDVREKHWSVASHMCSNWEQTHSLCMCPGQEMNPCPFCILEKCSNQLSHLARAKITYFQWGVYGGDGKGGNIINKRISLIHTIFGALIFYEILFCVDRLFWFLNGIGYQC